MESHKDFAKAEGRKRENGQAETRRLRGGGRFKKATKGVTWQKRLKSRDRSLA